MIDAPGFWWRAPGLQARLLEPVGVLYGAVAAWRMSRGGERSSLPVLCVGNFVVGGAGKTPFAIELARRLAAAGERPVFLTRGYGGSLEGPVLVSPQHDASEVGDEAMLLARHAPTVVARSRVAGAKLAEKAGASVIVMDDGFQNPSLIKDFSFAVVDAEAGIGNGLCLPAGPLRAPLATQWRFTQALVVMRGAAALPGPSSSGATDSISFLPGQKSIVAADTDHQGAGASPRSAPAGESSRGWATGESAGIIVADAKRRGLPVVSAVLVPEPSEADGLRGREIVAFAGIGRPSKFFATLRALGAELVAERGFPDHHRFRASELEALAGEARRRGAILATTEKDMMRIGKLLGEDTLRSSILAGVPLRVLKVGLSIDDAESLDSLLRRILTEKRRGGRA